jgi:hypothetical protein
MKKQISKDMLERHLNAVESAVRDSFPLNSSVVSGFSEIMRLALKGYDVEASSENGFENQILVEQRPVPQLGIR